MRITERQLRRIIRESISSKEAGMPDTPGQETPEIRIAAAKLGSLMAGQPPTAHAVADALRGTYPNAAKDLLDAYNSAQSYVDVAWMD